MDINDTIMAAVINAAAAITTKTNVTQTVAARNFKNAFDAVLGTVSNHVYGSSENACPRRHPVSPEGKLRCLVCQGEYDLLKRHLRIDHGVTVSEYRKMFNVIEKILVSVAYSTRRSAIAKEQNLGKHMEKRS